MYSVSLSVQQGQRLSCPLTRCDAQNADFSSGGEGDWGVGFGLLSVFVDDMYSPIITTPINLGATLQLDDGRSYVGLTAATGDEYWQAHDILRYAALVGAMICVPFRCAWALCSLLHCLVFEYVS